MTIKELYEWASCNGSEDKPLSVYCYKDGKLVSKEELEDNMFSDYSDEIIIGIDLPVEE